MVSSRASLTSWEEGASLALVGHPSSDGVTIKIPYWVDVLLHQPALHPHLFLLGWLQLNLILLLDHLRLFSWKFVPTSISGGVDISEVPGCHELIER